MKKLLVGYDGSGPAMEAAKVAGQLAKRLGAQVTVFTVGQIAPLVVAPTGMIVHVAEEQDFLPVARGGVQLVESVGAAAQPLVSVGDPAVGIVQMAGRDGYDLVVIGHRGMGRVAGMVLGSVAKRVAEESPCPVLVVRDRAPETIKGILVATDGSQHSRTAVEHAIVLAGAFGAEITLLYALDPKVLGIVADRKAKRELRHAVEHIGQEALEEAAGLCQKAGVVHKTVLAVGRPAGIILKKERVGGYDLVVVGRRGLGGMAGLLLGSVSDEVLSSARCPVLVVGERAKGKAAAGSEQV